VKKSGETSSTLKFDPHDQKKDVFDDLKQKKVRRKLFTLRRSLTETYDFVFFSPEKLKSLKNLTSNSLYSYYTGFWGFGEQMKLQLK